MPKKITQEEYLERLRKIRPNYDTSLIKYVNSKTKVKMICEHGHIFEQLPMDAMKYGCPICDRESKKKPVFGVGVNDLDHPSLHERCTSFWILMLRRCYDKKYLKNRPTYDKCYVSEDFLHLSNFKKWFDENYIEGYHLDKDILSPKNDVHYSPNTCCFIPPYINMLIKSKSKDKFTGVEKRSSKFIARHRTINGLVYLGTYNTEEEAIKVCTNSRKKYIKDVAIKAYSKKEISEKVYKALINFEFY